jgi:hypothetical protein
MKLHTLFLAVTLSTISVQTKAQCDSLASDCERYIGANYISDSQVYRALLAGDDVAEFQTTLFGGNIYRIAACSGSGESNLLFRLYDQDKNMLFSNTDFSNAPYWDFSLESTMTLTIEAYLDGAKVNSGCAVIVIGFRK